MWMQLSLVSIASRQSSGLYVMQSSQASLAINMTLNLVGNAD
jgi:hypothetical protein